MSTTYTCVIAAGGRGSRTGLGHYTSKAALPLRGRSLLGHQLDFARRSGCERVLVVCPPEHVRLLTERAPELQGVAFVPSDRPTGWAGEVERAAAYVGPDDEVLLLSCDNLHAGQTLRLDGHQDALFTFVRWDREDGSPTQGPVLARGPTAWGAGGDVWVEVPGPGFRGDFFAGYAAVRGRSLLAALPGLPRSGRGEKEVTTLLGQLARFTRCRAVPYPGTYEDVSDLGALARLEARLREDPEPLLDVPPSIGAAVVLHGDDRVLLTERADGLGWVPPGGIVEPGEPLAAAAVRELREEVGVLIPESALRLLGVYAAVGKHGEPACTAVFRAPGVPGVEVRLAEHEVASARWFEQEDIAGLQVPFGLRGALDDHFCDRELDVR